MKGVPFRSSHEIVGKIVSYAEAKQINLDNIKIDEFRKFSKHIEEDVYQAIDVEKSIHSKKSKGSTSPANVKKAATKILSSLKKDGYN